MLIVGPVSTRGVGMNERQCSPALTEPLRTGRHNVPLPLTAPGPAHACPSRAVLSLDARVPQVSGNVSRTRSDDIEQTWACQARPVTNTTPTTTTDLTRVGRSRVPARAGHRER